MQGTLIDFGEPANDNPFVTTPLQAPAPPVAAAAAEADDGSPTAILKGMFPGFDEEIMQAVLSHCDGNLELAAATLLDLAAEDEEPSPSAGIDEDAEVARAIAESNDAELAPRSREEEEQMAQMSGPAPGMGTRPAPEGTRWDGAGRLQIQGGRRRGRRRRRAPRAGGAPGARGRRAAREGVGARQEDPRGARRPRCRAVGGGGGSGGPGLADGCGGGRAKATTSPRSFRRRRRLGVDGAGRARAPGRSPATRAPCRRAAARPSTISTTRDAAGVLSRLARAGASTGRGRVDPPGAA